MNIKNNDGNLPLDVSLRCRNYPVVLRLWQHYCRGGTDTEFVLSLRGKDDSYLLALAAMECQDLDMFRKDEQLLRITASDDNDDDDDDDNKQVVVVVYGINHCAKEKKECRFFSVNSFVVLSVKDLDLACFVLNKNKNSRIHGHSPC